MHVQFHKSHAWDTKHPQARKAVGYVTLLSLFSHESKQGLFVTKWPPFVGTHW